MVLANDAERQTFTVVVGDGIVAVRGGDLAVLNEWRLLSEPPLLSDGWGCHSTRPADGLAALSTPDEVRLLESDGTVRWTFRHDTWAGFGRGCTWFGESGHVFAVVPDRDRGDCIIAGLEGGSGQLLSQARVRPSDPAGMVPLHQADGWVGVCESEGENAARTWFVRSENRASRLVVMDSGWDDEQLADVTRDGRHILTTGLEVGRITVRLFPTLDIVRTIDVGGDEVHQGACFVGPYVVTRLYHSHRTVAVDSKSRLHDLGVDEGWLVPAAEDSWLSVSRDGVRRWRLH